MRFYRVSWSIKPPVIMLRI